MEPQSLSPFESIENAQEYLVLLAEEVFDSRRAVQADLDSKPASGADRHLEALRMILYNLDKLGHHLKTSRRLLNDLRTLRRLLHNERTSHQVQGDKAA